MRKIVSLIMMLLCVCTLTLAQTRVVSGTVMDQSGQPVPFASVSVKGTNRGTSADAQGKFSIPVSGNQTLVISATGFNSSETVASGNTVSSVLSALTARTIDEVVVTAQGVRTKRKELGTGVSVINSETLNEGKAVNMASGLQGKVAGLNISNTGGGVNPNFRVVLRGQRSLTGNNQALLILDNVIVPNDVLGNLNPNDIESVTILNGGGAAALYGSLASNGAMIVTTKKGRAGRTTINLSHTTTFERVAFYPKFQNGFGAGGSSYGYDDQGRPGFSAIENQSYGPAFDGTMRELGSPLEDGFQLMVPYSYGNGHKSFWETGIQNQEDISLSTGDDKGTFYVSGQYLGATGTTPGDKYNRTTLRVNGTRKFRENILFTYSTGYVQNRYDQTTQTGAMYGNMLNMPGNVPITDYKNWRTDPLANPNGYYNPWYLNPYFSAENYRQKNRNDYLTGSVELKFTPIRGLDLIGRQGIATRNQSNKNTQGAFVYTEYAKHTESSSKSDITASVSDGMFYSTQLVTDGLAQYRTNISDFSLNATAGIQFKQDQNKSVGVSGNGLVVPGLFNVGNRVGEPGASESNFTARLYGIYGEARVGYKDFAFLHGTIRQDNVSILNKDNRRFSYPSVDGALIVSDMIEGLRGNTVSLFKLRAGWSKTGLVNLPGNYGAYQLLPTFGQAYGFPYGSNPGFTAGNRLVSAALEPEITKAFEAGFDLDLFQNRFTSQVTYYKSNTTNQTISTAISTTTGYSSLLTNVGETESNGWEVTAHVTPIRTRNLDFTFGGNYTLLNNNVLSISADVPKLALATYGSSAGSYAVAGMPFPVIMGFDYKRDPNGKVIVDGITGLPTKSDTISVLGTGVYKHRLSLDGALKIGNVTISALMDYRGGAQILNSMGGELDWSGTGARTATYNRERFVFPNSVILVGDKYVDNKNITIKDGNGNAGYWTDGVNRDVQSNYVTSADFWKLREVSMSYDLPNDLFNNSKFVRGATFSVQGRNLFVWTPKDNIYTDPEYSDAGNDSNGIGLTGIGQTPPSRFYGATISLRF